MVPAGAISEYSCQRIVQETIRQAGADGMSPFSWRPLHLQQLHQRSRPPGHEIQDAGLLRGLSHRMAQRSGHGAGSADDPGRIPHRYLPAHQRLSQDCHYRRRLVHATLHRGDPLRRPLRHGARLWLLRHSGKDDQLADFLQKSGDRRSAAAPNPEHQIAQLSPETPYTVCHRHDLCFALHGFPAL